uniref:Gamma-interferon-inducible lysosomal thiol reductase n=1 Tax=Hemiscolopendra marginata TaxID=943146 RepID=A0A646QGE0_9MYRI
MLRNVRAAIALAAVLLILFIFWKFLNNGQPTAAFDSKAFRPDKKVTISVYYETLCPDSIRFVRDQLWPTFNQLKSIIKIDLIPYGKASYHRDGDTWGFTCQHGPSECKGNKLQACAIKLYKDIELTMPFVYCVMTNPNPPDSGESCSKQNGLVWSRLSKCLGGTEGNNYLHEMGVRTEILDPRLVFVPWININGNHTDKIQEDALKNLKREVCQFYKGSKKPSACDEK